MKMDWEELKMSIRKTTARKGRRSKSRDPIKNNYNNNTSPTSSGTSTATNSNANKEISIDITLDIQPGSSSTAAGLETKRPPMLRRISGGWADSGVFKSSKSKKSTVDDERFHLNPLKSGNSIYVDDIPIIPDLDDIKDEVLLNEIVEPPTASLHRIPTLTDLESDLLTQKAFTQIEGVDLSVLARCLLPQNTLDEGDDVWEWDKLFTEVVAELNSEKRGCGMDIRPNTSSAHKLNLAPDELPPPLHI